MDLDGKAIRKDSASPRGSQEITSQPDRPLQSFGYDSLKKNPHQIRLCRFESPADPCQIKLKMETYALNEVDGKFVALSYAWGKEQSPESIMLNSVEFLGSRDSLTLNLHTHLCRMRGLDCNEMVWIDALCINQLDELEKSAQVAKMAEVFRYAKEVWIGLDEKATDLAVAASEHEIVSASIECLDQELHLDKIHPRSGTLLSRLLESLYFDRIWCVQEVCLARVSLVLTASDFVPWEVFTRAMRQCFVHVSRRCCVPAFKIDELSPDALYKVHCHLEGICDTKNKLRCEQHVLESIQRFAGLSALNKLDHLYGFYGLHTLKTGPPPPTPDYRKSPQEVFEEWTVWMLKTCRNLLPLALGLERSVSDLPSWVVDFSGKPSSHRWRGQISVYNTYDCKRKSGEKIEYITTRPGRLGLHGIQFDKVMSVTEVEFKQELPDTRDHVNILKKWFEFVTDRQTSAQGDTCFDDDRFVTTMLAGTVADAQGVRPVGDLDLENWRSAVSEMDWNSDVSPASRTIMESHLTAVQGRVLFKTLHKSIGIGDPSVLPGDYLWAVNGGTAPLLLRRTAVVEVVGHQQAAYEYIGYGYHYHYMTGQVDLQDRPRSCDLV